MGCCARYLSKLVAIIFATLSMRPYYDKEVPLARPLPLQPEEPGRRSLESCCTRAEGALVLTFHRNITGTHWRQATFLTSTALASWECPHQT
eukprot:2582291-Amphidinium_carterae.5